jgi:hypothetical protein
MWRRRFFVWEEDLFTQLRDLISPVTLSDAGDRWGWIPENGETYTVKSSFFLVSELLAITLNVSAGLLSAFNTNWKCPAPSKVRSFAWQLFHDRIPTQENLHRRRIIAAIGDQSCAMCGWVKEDIQHLFVYCEVAMKVWIAMFNWLNLPFNLPHNLLSIFNFLTHHRGKKLRRWLSMVWNGVIWAIWQRRNAVIFDNGRREPVEIIEEIKVTTWKWWLSQPKVAHSLLYEWQMEPQLCMMR